MLRRAVPLPHDRSMALITSEGAITARFARSIEIWTSSLLADDGISTTLEGGGREIGARLLVKQHGTFAGRVVANQMLERWTADCRIEWIVSDGQVVSPGDLIGRLQGGVKDVLIIERVLVNLLQRLSGIATTARVWSLSSPIPVAATRKTTWGLLDKWAVHLGGGLTHRLDREDGLMLKENDMAASHPDLAHEERINLRLTSLSAEDIGSFAVVETRSREEALAAARAWDSEKSKRSLTVMLDNIPSSECSAIHRLLVDEGLRSRVLLEASGGILFEDLDSWSVSGVDLLSTSAIHRGTTPLDISMLLDEVDSG